MTSTKTKKIKKGRKKRVVSKAKKVASKPKKERPKARPKIVQPKPEPSLIRPKPPKYYEAVGRRKTAVARIRMWTRGEKDFLVNDRPIDKYFPLVEFRQMAGASLDKMKCRDKFRIVARVSGGGLAAQAEAVRHGTARALILFNPDFRKRLRKVGYLTRDPRMRERKKFGLKRARRAPQWKKR